MSGANGGRKLTLPLEPGLHLLVGKPGCGKTALAMQLSMQAKSEETVVWNNLDMPKDDLMNRELSHVSGVSLPKMRAGILGGLSTEEQTAIGKAYELEIQRKRRIFTRPNVDFLTAEMHGIYGPIGMVVVDYVQKMDSRPKRKGEIMDPRRNQNACMKELSLLAIEWQVPVLVLAMSLRCHPEVLLYQNSYELASSVTVITTTAPLDPRHPAKTELDIIKNQYGEMRKITCNFKRSIFRFEECSNEGGAV